MYNRGIIVSEDERDVLIKWATDLIYPKMKMLADNRFHYIMLESDKDIIDLVWKIKDRLVNKENMSGYKKEPTLRDFLIFLPKGANVAAHRDLNQHDLIHTRFNVFISSPKNGCVTYYDNNVVDTTDCTYALCRSGIDEHSISTNEDTIPRITLSFGYVLPPEKIDSLTSDKTIGTYRFYPLSPLTL